MFSALFSYYVKALIGIVIMKQLNIYTYWKLKRAYLRYFMQISISTTCTLCCFLIFDFLNAFGSKPFGHNIFKSQIALKHEHKFNFITIFTLWFYLDIILFIFIFQQHILRNIPKILRENSTLCSIKFDAYKL